jgi:hypothetical protein
MGASSESVFASLIEPDDETTASLAAISLPLHVVRASRRASRRARYRLRLPDLPWARVGQRASLLLLWLPSLLVLAAALWAGATGIRSLLHLLGLVVTLQFDLAAAELPHIDAAGRVVLASVGYFLLLAALRQLARGLFGRGWARLWLVLAIPLVLPSAWLFVAGAELATAAAPLSRVAPELWRLLLILLVFDAIALAVLRTREQRAPSVARVVSRRATRLDELDDLDDLDLSEMETERLPIVRFGPPTTEQVSHQPGIEPEMADTQSMRVPGLLHLLSESRQEDAPERARTDSTE